MFIQAVLGSNDSKNGIAATLHFCDGAAILEVDPTRIRPIDLFGAFRAGRTEQTIAAAGLLSMDLPLYIAIDVEDREKTNRFLKLLAGEVYLHGGSVLTLTYLGSQRVFTNYNVMGVAKAALEATVRYLASDLGPDNIRVNAISAGPIKTLAAMGIKDFSSIRDVYKERTPLRRNVELDDVAEAAMFLLGPSGRGVTGEVLMVDAGFHVMGGA